jgi:ppGpp synthetase/RelA/SpoT-type nucleotidyltranferase
MNAQDIAGARVTASSPKQFEAEAAKIKKNFNIIEDIDYIANPKDGYRSRHLIAAMPDGTHCEIQLRTKNQTAWADWAHEQIYKTHATGMKARLIEKHMPEIKQYSLRMSEYFAALDDGASAQKPPCVRIIKITVTCL